MSVTTTSALVQGVLGREYDSVNSPDLSPYMSVASSLVDQMVSCATRKGLTISSDDQTLLQTWLAAHAYQMADPGYQSRSTLSASGQFQGQFGMRFEMTRFGQMALTLDTTGCLENIGKRQKASFSWTGKTASEQTNYWDRN